MLNILNCNCERSVDLCDLIRLIVPVFDIYVTVMEMHIRVSRRRREVQTALSLSGKVYYVARMSEAQGTNVVRNVDAIVSKLKNEISDARKLREHISPLSFSPEDHILSVVVKILWTCFYSAYDQRILLVHYKGLTDNPKRFKDILS